VRYFLIVFRRNIVAFHSFEDVYDVVYEGASVVEPGKPHVLRAKDCLDDASFAEELEGKQVDDDFETDEHSLIELAKREEKGEFGIDPPL
jgi:hypothetical protein